MGGKTYRLNGEDRAEAQEIYGETAYDLLKDIFKANSFDTLSQDEQESIIEKVFTVAADTAKQEYADDNRIDVEYKTVREREAVEAAGLDYTEYLILKTKAAGVKETTDSFGRVQSRGSQIKDMIESTGFSYKQQLALWVLLGYAESTWYNY